MKFILKYSFLFLLLVFALPGVELTSGQSAKSSGQTSRERVLSNRAKNLFI